jgi:hypothetical protein
MGLLTADVTPIGVVTTGDSQPVELRESSYTVPVATQGNRPCLVAHKGADFAAALGFVGTERIGASPTYQWLERYSKANHGLTLVEFGESLAAELSVLWGKHSYDTCLWIFISGSSGGEPVFRAIRNCGPDMDQALLYTQIGPDFVCIDDLANHVAQYRSPGESPLQTLTQHMALYRNGVLLPAVAALDSFQALMQGLLSGGFQGFAPMSALSGYASVVKMRGEFVKRLFDANKGIYRANRRPIAGKLYVMRVELDGSIYDHAPKSSRQAVRLL